MKDKLKCIPNILCCARLALVFVFVYLALNDMLNGALLAFLVAGATDVLDGFLSRKNGWVTELGKILDPLADKLMQCTVLVILYYLEILPIWFSLIFILKEIVTLVMGLWVIRKKRVVVVSRWYGKAAVCLFYATVVMSVLFDGFLKEHPFVLLLMLLPAAVLAIGAFIAYVKHYYSCFKLPKTEPVGAQEIKETL